MHHIRMTMVIKLAYIAVYSHRSYSQELDTWQLASLSKMDHICIKMKSFKRIFQQKMFVENGIPIN